MAICTKISLILGGISHRGHHIRCSQRHEKVTKKRHEDRLKARKAARRKKIAAALAKQFQAERLKAKKIDGASKENPNSHKSILKSLSPFDKQFLDESKPQTCPNCGESFRRRLHFVWHSTSCGRKEESAAKVSKKKGRSEF